MSSHGHGLVRLLFGWEPEKIVLRETSWLDGLRGAAAFLVMFHHFSTLWVSHFFSAPFGAVVRSNVDPDNTGMHNRQKGEVFYGVWRLPIIRLISSALAHVTLFYVLSGFVLSWSAVALIHSEEYGKLSHSLGSSIVRRWSRLYLAGAIVSVGYLIHKIYAEDFLGDGPLAITWDYIIKTEAWANPFDTNHITPLSTNHNFNGVMWTLPFEFSGSIFVFVAMVALGRIRSFRRRATTIILVSSWALFKLRWDYWLFGTGFVLADYIRHRGGFRKLSQNLDAPGYQLWCIVLVFGMLLMGWAGPMPWYTNPGYAWSESLPLPPDAKEKTGEGVFVCGFGSILVLLSACHLSSVRGFFELAVFQHLGRVSFMMYLCHMLVGKVVAIPVKKWMYKTFCSKIHNTTYESPDIYDAGTTFTVVMYFTLFAISIPITVCLAHYLEVYIDRPCQNFGRWLDSRLVNESVEKTLRRAVHEEKLLAVDEKRPLRQSTSGIELHGQLSDSAVLIVK